MVLDILAVTPANKDNDVTIDSKIVIEVSEAVDEFTIATGISLYTASKGLWDDKILAGLDTKYKEVLDIGDVNTSFPFRYQVIDKVITITPEISLLPDTTFFVDIFPGNDATRYLSKKTVGTPITVSANGSISINSAYTGLTDDSFEISFSSSDGLNTDTIEVAKGIKYISSLKFKTGEELNLGELRMTLNGTWDITDSISIPVYKASGLASIARVEFTTSKYETVAPKSTKIEYISDTVDPFIVTRTIPDNMSVNNKSINPIVIEFNKTLKTDQNLVDKIRIKRTGFEDGASKNINEYYKIEGNILKIYMISTSRI